MHVYGWIKTARNTTSCKRTTKRVSFLLYFSLLILHFFMLNFLSSHNQPKCFMINDISLANRFICIYLIIFLCKAFFTYMQRLVTMRSGHKQWQMKSFFLFIVCGGRKRKGANSNEAESLWKHLHSTTRAQDMLYCLFISAHSSLHCGVHHIPICITIHLIHRKMNMCNMF